MSGKRRYRCAIYTRKSHEEGLDQDFNSLDAQREACEAYVLSQAGLGWELIDKAYDDGGISGGHMERDGLQHLLTDIRSGRVDVVVVYKVDRLTRSITDFGRLVEAFDHHDVSFVSVTQAFNTTNSMGRLTLNVLLSFAQFEREVTAERIRDKIAGSKQKGMWMGGRVPFGYRNENKQLFIDRDEAETVRLIFDLYRERHNIRFVKPELDRRGILSRKRTNNTGQTTGGTSFSRGNISSILSNPIYAGQIKHKDNVYPGNHEAIIDQDEWNNVQVLLKERSVERSNPSNCKSPALLNGLMQDVAGNRLICHHANKNGQKYHYYVSKPKAEAGSNRTDKQSPSLRLPIAMIENTIHDILLETLMGQSKLIDILKLENLDAEQVLSIISNAETLADEFSNVDHDARRSLYHELIQRITICANQIKLTLNPACLSEKLSISVNDGNPIEVTKHIAIRRRGQEMKLVINGVDANSKPNHDNKDHALINLIAKVHLLRTELAADETLSIKQFAIKNKLDHGDVKNLIPLSFLAPTIIEDIMAGHQPTDLTTSYLKSLAHRLPILWSDQRTMLGFANS